MAATYGSKTGSIVAPTDLSKIFLSPRADNSGLVNATTAWSQPIWTLKNSLTFDQVQGAKTEVNVDQTTTAIAVKYAAGTTTFTFRILDMNQAVVGLFYDTATFTGAADVGAESGAEAVTGYGFSQSLKVVSEYMVMLKYTNGWGIIFPHCEMVAALKKSGEDVWTMDITGTVLAGDSSGEPSDFIILQPDSAT